MVLPVSCCRVREWATSPRRALNTAVAVRSPRARWIYRPDTEEYEVSKTSSLCTLTTMLLLTTSATLAFGTVRGPQVQVPPQKFVQPSDQLEQTGRAPRRSRGGHAE